MADVRFGEIQPDRLVEGDMQRSVERGVGKGFVDQHRPEARGAPGHHAGGQDRQASIGPSRALDRAPVERQLQGQFQDGGIAGLGGLIGAP